MADYRESSVEGTSWTRAFLIEVNNPVDGISAITFHEEQAIRVPNLPVLTQRSGQVVNAFTQENAATLFPVYDADTGDPISQTQYRQVRNILYSLYLHIAQQRDAEIAARIAK